MSRTGKNFLAGLLDKVTTRSLVNSRWFDRGWQNKFKAKHLALETLEDRQLLAVAYSEYLEYYVYEDICAAHPEFNLGEYGSANTMVLSGTRLTADNLKTAINDAMATGSDDLIVLKTTAENFALDLGSTPLTLDINSTASGTLTIVGYGSVDPKVGAEGDVVMKVNAGTVNLGNLTLVGTQEKGAAESVILDIGRSAKVTQSDVTLSVATYWTENLPAGGDAKIMYNEGIYSVDFSTDPTSVYRSYVTGMTSLDQVNKLLENQYEEGIYHEDDEANVVYTDSNFVDVDIYDTIGRDSNLAWAGISSDMLSYTGWGNAIATNPEAVYSYYVDNFTDGKGSLEYGLNWFMNGLENYYSSNADFATATAGSGNLFDGKYQFNDFGGSFESDSYYMMNSSRSPLAGIDQLLKAGYAVGANLSSAVTTLTESYDVTTVGGVPTKGTPTETKDEKTESSTGAVTIWGYKYNKTATQNTADYYVGLFATVADDDPRGDLAENQLEYLSVSWNTLGDAGPLYTYEFDGYGRTEDFKQTVTPGTQEVNTETGVITQKDSYVDVTTSSVAYLTSFVYLARAEGYAPVEQDRYEPNDTMVEVDSAVEGATDSPNLGIVSGLVQIDDLNVAGTDPCDWFKFKTRQGCSIADYVAVQYDTTLFSGDLRLSLHTRDTEGNVVDLGDQGFTMTRTQISSVDEYGNGTNTWRVAISLAGLPACEDGQYYYVCVERAKSTVDCKDYSLLIQTCSDDAYELNNTRKQVLAHAEGGDTSPNLGQITVPELVVSDLILKQASVYSGATSEVDGFRFIMTGYGGENSWIEIRYDATNHDNSPNDSDLDLYLYRDYAEGAGYTTGWGDLVAQSVHNEDNGVERISLDGLTPGTYYIKVGGFVNAENLQNYKMIIHLRDEGDLPGIGITSEPDYYVDTPEEWSGPVVATSESYASYDPEKSVTDKFTTEPVMYTQDTIYLNMDLAAAASCEDGETVKVAVTVNGVRLKDLEITLDAGQSAFSLEQLQDIVLAKLTSETWLTANDGKLWEGIEEYKPDQFSEGMVLNIVNGQDLVTGCYAYHNGSWVAVASATNVANGTLLTLSDGTKVQYYKVDYKLVSRDVNENKVVSDLKALYRTSESGQTAAELWPGEDSVELTYVAGTSDGTKLSYDTATGVFTNVATGRALTVATGSLLVWNDGTEDHYLTYNDDAELVTTDGGAAYLADTFYDWGALTPTGNNTYCTAIDLTLVDNTTEPATYTYNLTSRTFKNSSGMNVTGTSGALYTYGTGENTQYLTYTKTGTKVVFYDTIVDLSDYAATKTSELDPYVTGKALTLADGSVIYYRADGKFYSKVNVALDETLTLDDGQELVFSGVATPESITALYPYMGIGDGLFLTDYNAASDETFMYGAEEVSFDAVDNKFTKVGTTTQVNITAGSLLSSTTLGNKAYGEVVRYNGSKLVTSWKQDGESVTVEIDDILEDLWDGSVVTYDGNLDPALIGHEFMISGTDTFVRFDGKGTGGDDLFVQRLNTPENQTLTTGTDDKVVYEENAFYSLYNDGTIDNKTKLTVDAGTVAVRKVEYRDGEFYKYEQADPVVKTEDGAAYTVRDGGLYNTYTSENFFADGTRFVLYNDTDVDGQRTFASSNLYITPSAITAATFGLYTNVIDMVVDPDNEYPEYNESNNKASTSFNVFRYQDDFFIPNQTLDEMLQTENKDVYESDTVQVANSEYNPNLGAITSTFTVKGLALVTPEDWFSFEIQGETAEENKVEITFNPDLGDIDLYVYQKDEDYPGGYKLVGRSATLSGTETVSLKGFDEGTYYIQVKGFRKEVNPSYDLTIVGVEPMDISEVGLTLGDPNVINSSALISWNKAEADADYVFGGADEYFLGSVVEWSTDPDFAPEKTETITVGRYQTSLTLTGLEPDTTYYYRVSAYNAFGLTETGEYCYTDWFDSTFKTDDFYKETEYFGLIIGAELYRDYDALPFASTDAKDAYNALLKAAPQWHDGQDGNLQLLTGNVSKADIQAAIDAIDKAADANDVVFVYYVGLGTTVDAGGETKSLIHTYSDSYTSGQFSDLFSVLDVAQLQVVLNPYYVNTSVTDYIDFDYDRFATSIVNKVQDENTTVSVITGADNGENSEMYDGQDDAFGHFFTDGLSNTYEFEGKTWYVADTNRDGQVSMQELYEYVDSNVSELTGSEQNPQFYPDNQPESIVIKGDWKETADNFEHFAEPWWDAEAIVVTTAQDIVDSTDGKVSLREAVNYLGNTLYKENILADRTEITLEGATTPVEFSFSEAATLGLNPGDGFSMDGVDYTYRQGVRCNVNGNIALLNDQATFTWNDKTIRYELVNDGENKFTDVATEEPVDLFAENTTVTVTLEDGSTARLSETGVAIESLLLDKIVFDTSLANAAISLDKSDIQIDNSGLKAGLETITIDASSLKGTLTINGSKLIDSTAVDEAETEDGPGDARRIFTISANAEVTLAGLKLTGANLNNADKKEGAAIAVVKGKLYLVNMLIYGNTAEKGGAIYNGEGSFLTIVNSTIADNTAGEGRGLYNLGTATIYNSLLFDKDTPDEQIATDPIAGTGTTTIEYSLVNAHTDTSNGNISSAGITRLDLYQHDDACVNFTYNIADKAEVINKANEGYARWSDGSSISTDLNGIDRRSSGGVDMGAYEWQSKDTKLSTIVNTLHENGKIDETISLREAISYAGTTVVYVETLNAMEGEQFILNGETVYAEKGQFVTHSAGDFVVTSNVPTAMTIGAKLIDIATGKVYFYQGNGEFTNESGNAATLAEGTTVQYYVNPEGATFTVGTYSKHVSVAFTEYNEGDLIECLSDSSTGIITKNDKDETAIEKTVVLGTDVKFDLDAIKAEYLEENPGADWEEVLKEGLIFNLESAFGGTLGLGSTVTIDGANVIGTDKSLFLNGKGFIIASDEVDVTSLVEVNAGAGEVITLNRLSFDGNDNANAITVTNGELQATGLDLYESNQAITVNGGTATLTDSVVYDNANAITVGADANLTVVTSDIYANNNAITVGVAGTMTITSSSIYNNVAETTITNDGTLTLTGTKQAPVLIYGNSSAEGIVVNRGTLTGNYVWTYDKDAADISTSGNTGSFLTQDADEAEATFNNSKLYFGTANQGAAVNATAGKVLLYTTDVAGNTVEGGNGGGIAVSSTAEVTVVNSLIRGNYVDGGSGGGLSINGAGAKATLLYTTVAGNLSDTGRGIYVAGGTLKLQDSVVAQNYQDGWLDYPDVVAGTGATVTLNNSFIGSAEGITGSIPSDSHVGTTIAPLDAEFVKISVDVTTMKSDCISWDLHSKNDDMIIGQGDGVGTYTDLTGAVVTISFDFGGTRARVYNGLSDMGAYTNEASVDEEIPSTIVTTGTDIWDPTDGLISLREAVEYALQFADDPQYPDVTSTITFDVDRMGTTIVQLEDRQDDLGDNEIAHGGTINLSGVFTIDGYDPATGNNLNITVRGTGEDRLFLVKQEELDRTEVEIKGLTFTEGYAKTKAGSSSVPNGGAFLVEGGVLKLSDCILHDNTAIGSGGAIYQRAGTVVITNSLLYDNKALGKPSGSFNNGGGAIRSVDGWLEIVKTTITDNVAENSNYGGVYATDCIVTMYNSILADNTDQVGAKLYDFYARNYSGVAYNAIGAMGDASGLNGINGNIVGTLIDSLDVGFERTGEKPYTYYSLKNDSQAVNKGAKSLAVYPSGAAIANDLHGNPLMTLVSMGCYENENVKDPSSTVVTTLLDEINPTDGLVSLREAYQIYAKSTDASAPDTITFDIAADFETTGWDGISPLVITLKSPLLMGDATNITIDGRKNGEEWLTGGITITGAGNTRLFELNANDELTAYNLNLTEGNAGDGALGGGAMLLKSGSKAKLYNTMVYGNKAVDNGRGAAFYLDGGRLELVNCTVAGNTSANSGAIHVGGSSSNLILHNTVVSDNNNGTAVPGTGYDITGVSAGKALSDADKVVCSVIGSLDTSIGQSGFVSSFVGTLEKPVTAGFVEAPTFSTSTGLISNLATVDFTPDKDSLLINSGANTFVGYTGFIASLPDNLRDSNSSYIRFDIQGNDRVLYGTVDMGAIEYFSTEAEDSVEVPSTIVTTLDDIVDRYDNQISIREAISYAGMSYIDESGRKVTLGTTVTFLGELAGGTITLNPEAGAITISTSVTIDASALSGGITLDANSTLPDLDEASKLRVFVVAAPGKTVTLNSLTITGGNAGTEGGGGIYHTGGRLVIINSLIYGNQANKGGGILSDISTNDADSNSSSLDLINCTITKNNAAIYDTRTGGGYGGLYALRGTVTLENTLIAMNTSGAAKYTDDEGDSHEITPDSELYTFDWLSEHGYFTLDMFVNASKLPFYSSLIGKMQSWINTTAFQEQGNLAGTPFAALDPRFVNWDENHFSLNKSETGVNSPAINAGDSTLLVTVAPGVAWDIAGNERYIGRVDIGAFESAYGAKEMPSTIVTTLDDVVNDADGLISLREAIAYAGTNGLGTTVTFMESLSGKTFYLDSQLFIDKTVTIDGASLGDNIVLSVADEVTDQRIIYVNNGTVTLKGLTLTNHYTQRLKNAQTLSISQGGAIYQRAGTLNLYNVLIYDNYAVEGSAIYVADGSAVNLNIMNSTITDNRVGLAGKATVQAGSGRVNIQNSIIAQNGLSNDRDVDLVAGNLYVGNSFIQKTNSVAANQRYENGNYIGSVTGSATDAFTIEANALFVDWANDNFQLNNSSVAVNAGDNTYVLYDANKKAVFSGIINFSENDVIGNRRLVGQTVDMGALENQVVTDNYYTVSHDEITVTTQFDVVNPSDGLVSLREAITLAEHLYDLGINKTITFSTVYLTDNAVMNMDIKNLVISRPITIDASMIHSFVIDAGGKNNILSINTSDAKYAGQSVTLLNLELRNGSAGKGGAIYHGGGDLILLNTLIHTNTAVYESTASSTASYGGGIYSLAGSLTLVNCTVANNTATYGGGIYVSSGSLKLYNSIVAMNFVVGGTDKTNVDLAVNTASYDIQHSFLGNAYSFRSLNGVNNNQVGYGDDNSIDPDFIDIATGNFRLDAGSPCRGEGNFQFVHNYGLQYDLDGNVIGLNDDSEEYWNMLSYIERAEARATVAPFTLEALRADMATAAESAAMAQNVLNDSNSSDVNSISGLYSYYNKLEQEAVTANNAISSLQFYVFSATGETSLDGYLKYLEQWGLTLQLELCNRLIAERAGVEGWEIKDLAAMESALNGRILYIENMNIPQRRAFVIASVSASGAVNLAELQEYFRTLITDGEAVADLESYLASHSEVTTVEGLKEILRDELSSAVALGAYQPTREARSTVVTTELDVVDAYDGLISLREALINYDTNNRLAYYKSQQNGGSVTVGYSGVGGAYGHSVSTSDFYSNERLLVNYSPVTFADNMAGKTIKLDATLGSIRLENFVLGTVYYWLVDASSIAARGGITIDASGCDYAFEAIGDKLKDVDLIAISYAEFEGIRVTGAERAAFHVDPFSVVETRNSLIYRNGNAFYIQSMVENNIRYYGIAHVYNSTVANNAQYAFENYGKVFGYNSIFSLNGYGTSIGTAEVSLSYCLCQSPITPSYDVYGTANIYVEDPLFVDQANDDYHLSRYSLAINTGNPDFLASNRPSHAQAQTDLDGNPRTWNGLQGVVDIGCYEMSGKITEEGELIGYVDVPSTVVTTAEDLVDPSDGFISIREAIAYAEQYQYMKYDPSVRNGLKIDRVVTFDASLNGATITLENGTINLLNDITIDARALSLGVTLDGDKKSNIFSVDIDQSKYNNMTLPTKVNVYLYGVNMTGGSSVDGGAVYIKSGNVFVQDCDIYGNTASGSGGAIYIHDSELTLRGVNIGGNKANYYGGVASFNGTVLFEDTWIANNRATATGADYDFYYETVGNENSTGSNKSVFGSTRNLRLTGHGGNGDTNWIGNKDNANWDYGATGFVESVDQIFDAAQGSWDENGDWTGVLARNAAISFGTTAAAALPRTNTATPAQTASASYFASLEDEDVDVLSPWFEEP
ncbi:MAG: fibronectin type III domain-containing protein [Planctomycetia bacterium]|nr:fibronectin type III domain-containing protein [Planctomycetia bacterium]